MKRPTTVGLTILIFCVLAFAHGGEEHVMGTVSKIEKGSITVTTTAGARVTVIVNDKTQFSKSDGTASLADLKEGDRVVIHAKKTGAQLVAHTGKLGNQAATPTANPK